MVSVERIKPETLNRNPHGLLGMDPLVGHNKQGVRRCELTKPQA